MYSFRSKVRFSEIGEDGRLRLSSVINYFQDCSTFQTEELGLGFRYLEKQDKVWILVSWQVIVHEYPALCEDIKVGTWPYDFKGFFGYRNYVMENEQHQVLAEANSVWIYMDTATGKPVKINEEVLKGYELEERLPMDYAPRKVTLPKIYMELQEFPIRHYHIDTNRHVNNGQYIQLARECIPHDFIVKEVRADYRKAAVLGDRIFPLVCQTPEKYTVVLADSDKVPYVVVEFYQ